MVSSRRSPWYLWSRHIHHRCGSTVLGPPMVGAGVGRSVHTISGFCLKASIRRGLGPKETTVLQRCERQAIGEDHVSRGSAQLVIRNGIPSVPNPWGKRCVVWGGGCFLGAQALRGASRPQARLSSICLAKVLFGYTNPNRFPGAHRLQQNTKLRTRCTKQCLRSKTPIHHLGPTRTPSLPCGLLDTA